MLGTTTSLVVTNSRGAPTFGGIWLGAGRAAVPTPFGGVLLVDAPMELGTWLLAAGVVHLPVTVPAGNAFCDLVLDLQLLELDPGASAGVSFSAGLEVVLGR